MEELPTSATHRSSSTADFRPSRSASPPLPNTANLRTSRTLLQQSTSFQGSNSTSTLRFPTPEGSHLLAHWVTSSSADTVDTMQPCPSDEANSLADSAYELISSIDGDSQDGRSPGSIDDSLADSVDLYPRPDDVRSLSGHDAVYDDEEDDEDEEDEDEEDEDEDNGEDGNDESGGGPTDVPYVGESSHSIRYAEEALGSPSTQSHATTPDFEFTSGNIGTDGPSSLTQSIEFNEGDEVNVYVDKISVKHTVRSFTEAESAVIAKNMGLPPKPPKRLLATIRQTMAHHCLPTREPLRVLYVGSDAAYNDIMYKISSALLASASSPSDRPNEHGAQSRQASNMGIYNIMPISSFGTTKVPEIDEIQLMGVSDYYIKVDRCMKADEVASEASAYPKDTVVSITLDNERTYFSHVSPRGSVVRPQWTLPHVAVFYVSGNDDLEAEATRNAAWEFMTRHAVPSIFITHEQSFSRSPSAGRWQEFVDQAAVHLSLESGDPHSSIAPERLPIDLSTFLSIDARQMNRNLAYLTGLVDRPAEAAGVEKHTNEGGARGNISDVVNGVKGCLRLIGQGSDPRRELSRTFAEACKLVRRQNFRTSLGMAFVVFLSTCISLVLSPYVLAMLTTSLRTPEALSASATYPVTQVTDASNAAAATQPSICYVPSVTPTVTISFTSTTTVEISASGNSNHMTPTHFGGFLTDRGHHHIPKKDLAASESEIKSTGCSIQVYSDHEILVKVPSGTKTTWLAKGAIDIDVWRGQRRLKSMLSTTDEGIIIGINKNDAHGVMNVSVVTTRRPKINETFAVDFGKPTGAKLLEAGARVLKTSFKKASDTGRDAAISARKAILTYADNVNKTAVSQAALEVFDREKQRCEKWWDAADRTGRQFSDKAKQFARGPVRQAAAEAQTAVYDSLDQASQRMPPAEELRERAKLSILRAQIASKLWWLRVQGRMEEHTEYEEKSTQLLRAKELAAAQGTAERRTTAGARERTQKVVYAVPEKSAVWFWGS